MILQPQESFSTNQWTGLLADSRTKTKESAPTFGEGYVMQLIVLPWPSDDWSSSHPLAQKWRDLGVLETTTLESAFFPMRMPQLPEPGKSEPCKGFPERHKIRQD